jgi:predicted  nucleic acid-binding Zn-ribbon protein
MNFFYWISLTDHFNGLQVAKSVKNELECVTNHTLSSVIEQLSSLSHHAEDMFEDLSKEANNFFGRANQLQNRIDHLRDKVKQLDAERELGLFVYIVKMEECFVFTHRGNFQALKVSI